MLTPPLLGTKEIEVDYENQNPNEKRVVSSQA